MSATYLWRMCRPVGGVDHRAGPAAPGATVLIPTYSPPDAERVRRLRRCVHSVLAGGAEQVTFVVVDNGLTVPAAREVGALLAATGRPYAVVDATVAAAARVVGGRYRYTAAGARNAGLAALAALPPTDPLRRRYLLFLDDDTAAAPGAVAALASTLDENADAVAACPRVVPVADPGRWLAGQERHLGLDDPPRPLAGPVHDGRYDLLSVTSHGSLVTGRTVGLLVRQAPVLDLIRRHGPLFFEDTPFGSAEDMLAMAMLSRLGRLWSVPAARVADEARDTPGATRTQQFAWGYDHAWLVRALAGAGVLERGVHVLAWEADGWWHRRLPWAGENGFLVNPHEVWLGYRMLAAAAADRSALPGLLGVHAGAVRAGLPLLGRVLRRWRADAAAAPALARTDLPPLAERDRSSLRDGLDALLGHLAGNIAGSTANGFLYGARQPAGAEPPRDLIPAGAVAGNRANTD